LGGECVFANQNAASITGTTVENLLSQNFHSIETWKQSGLYDLVQKAITTRTVVTGDVHFTSTFGKEIWMTVYCVTFTSNNEEHVLISMLDIRERKQAENKLLLSQQELTEAQRVAKIGSWSFDPLKNQVHWSDELYRIFGVDRENFNHTYDGFLALIHPEDRLKVNVKNTQALQNEKTFEIEYRVITPEGIKTINEIGYTLTSNDGQIVRLFGTAQDITHRKRIETERQALFEIMQGLAVTNDLGEFLKLIHSTIAKVIYAENFFVVMYHPDTGLFEEIYTVDEYDPPAPPSRLEKSITSYVFRSGEPLLLTNDGFQEFTSRHEMELIGTDSASWLGAPLKTANGTIGVIAVQDYQDANRYSERDKDFLASVASQIALAVERKQAERDLNKAREFLQGVQDSLSAHIAILDQHGVIVQVNTAWCEFGERNGLKSANYCIGENYLDICGSATGTDVEVAHQVAASIREVLAGKQREVSVEYPCHSSQGKRWFTVHITCFDDGEQKWVILAHENITTRMKAESALQESTLQLRTLFEASPDAIMLIDPQGNWPIVDCNPAACRMNGYTREELIGKSVDILNTENSTVEEHAEYFEQVQNTDVLRYETSHVHKNGTVFPIEVSTSLIRLGERDLVLGIDRDITERRRAEEAAPVDDSDQQFAGCFLPLSE
jgi:PAS domain S-box-containing protein